MHFHGFFITGVNDAEDSEIILLCFDNKLVQQKSVYAFFFHAFIGNNAVEVLETINDFYDVFSVEISESFPIFFFDFFA